MSTRFEWKHGGNHVLLAGAFTAWKAYPMTHVDDSPNWYYNLDLPIGTHHFKFVVDGVWRVDNDQPQSGKKPHLNNVVQVAEGVSRTKHGGGSVALTAPFAVRTRVGQTETVETSAKCARALEEGAAVNFGESLKELYLSSSGIIGETAGIILQALKAKNSLTTLNLSHNPLGDTFLEHLVPLLTTTAPLRSLYLWSTSITDAGAAHLARVLAAKSPLTTLQLRGNSLGPAGAAHITRALASNTTLTHLDLWNNPLGDEGLVHVAEAVRSNKTLLEVHAGEGVVTGAACAAWSKALKQNQVLTDVHLFHNDRRPFLSTLTELGKN